MALVFSLASSCTCTDASHNRDGGANIQLRGGAASKQPPWTSSPMGIRRPQQQQKQQYPIVSDLDDDSISTKETIDAFLTRDSRNTFIARVYAILSTQLVFTAMVITFFGLNPGISKWMRDAGRLVPFLSLGLSTIAWFAVASSTKARREAPLKWQLLALFTIGEAISVGFISSFYKFQTVVSAMLATTAATTGVSLYTILQKNAKYDLSQWGAGLSSFALIFLIYGLINLLEVVGILPKGFMPYNDALYCLIGAGLFSFFLAYHTRLIVSGKHTKYQMNEKDYVFGAMSLYNDVINIFIYILRLVGEDKDDR
jgi:FtsH-binding integral membrane protein